MLALWRQYAVRRHTATSRGTTAPYSTRHASLLLSLLLISVGSQQARALWRADASSLPHSTNDNRRSHEHASWRQNRAIFTSSATQIGPQPCRSFKSGRSGVCMFVWECAKEGGTPVGICTDRFMFGGCCELRDKTPVVSVISPSNAGDSEVLIMPQSPVESVTVSSDLDGWTSLLQASSTLARPSPTVFTGSVAQLSEDDDVGAGVTNQYFRPASGSAVGGLFGGSGVWSAAHHPTSTRKPYPRPQIISVDTMAAGTHISAVSQFPQRPLDDDIKKRPVTAWVRPQRPTRPSPLTQVDNQPSPVGNRQNSTVPRTTTQTQDSTTVAATTTSTTGRPVTASSFLSSTATTTSMSTAQTVSFSAGSSAGSTETTAVESLFQETTFLNDTEVTTSTFWPRPSRPTRPTTIHPQQQTSHPTTINTTKNQAVTPETTSSISESAAEHSTPPVLTTTTPPPARATTVHPSITTDNTECGVPPLFSDIRDLPSSRIVGGKNAPFGGFPWQVSVRRTSFFGLSTTHRCGGALLNEMWIATAGHCVDDLLLSQIRIRVGEYDFGSILEPFPYQERSASAKHVHPQYNFYSFEYDLALVKLAKSLQLTPNVHPICLPASSDLMVGENATVTGWGRLSEGGTLPSVLQQATVPIMENNKCKKLFQKAGRNEYIPDIFLCAGYETGGTDSCQGDSGGPLQVRGKDGRWFLAGIISWGIGCAEPNLPGVCTRISKFTEWILNKVENS